MDEKDFYNQLVAVRKEVGDRAILRAIHLFNENKRVEKAVSSLKNNDFDTFKQVIKDSGDSSYKYLQNVYSNKYPDNQAVSLALALSEGILENHGVCRVHGGGFAGTIQAFVEDEYVDHYKEEIEKYFGEAFLSCLKSKKIWWNGRYFKMIKIEKVENNIDLITLKNDELEVVVSNYGCTLVKVLMKDQAGNVDDVVLGYDDFKSYQTLDAYIGALVGRVANRIKKGTFELNGQTYHLPINNGPNSLHGGIKGFFLSSI